MAKDLKTLLGQLPKVLDDSLRQPRYRGKSCHLAGHCYVACEVIFHTFPGKYKPEFIRHEDEPHWFLRDHQTNKPVDPTAGQFVKKPNYSLGRGIGFLTKRPSKRAQIVLDRLKAM